MRLKICDGCESSSLHTYVTKGPSRRKRDWTPTRPAVGTWSASPSRLALSLMRKLNCTRATRYSRKPNWASVSSICKLLYPSTKHCFPQQLVLRRRFLLFSYSVSIILGDSSADAAAWPVQHLTLSVSPLADSSFLSPFYPPYCLSLFISTLTKSPDLSILSIIPQSPPSCLPNCSHCICSIKYFEALLYTNLSFIILYMNFHQLFSLLVLL